MMKLLFKRHDGSFVAEVTGLPYHVEVGSDLYDDAEKEAIKLGSALEYEPAPAVPEPTISDYEVALQGVVDATARAKLFRDGVTLASYIASTNPQWAAEAVAFVAWRDGVWAYAYTELAKVKAGQREQPTVEEFLAEIDPIEWPSSATA